MLLGCNTGLRNSLGHSLHRPSYIITEITFRVLDQKSFLGLLIYL